MAKKMTEREQFYYDKGYNKAIEEAADLARKRNKMEVVAALFGKKLGEEFVVKDRYRTEWCKFTEHGLLCLDKAFFLWQNSDKDLLQHLLKGTAVIVDE